MAITKEKKISITKEFSEKIKDAVSLVFINFKGLTVKETIAFRRSLRAEDVGYTVIKKTLMKRVLANRGFSGTEPDLVGEIAVAYGSDPLIPARSVYKFTQDSKDKVKIAGGVFDGAYLDAPSMLAIGSIPPLPVLYGQFVGLVQSPIRSFVSVLANIAGTKTS